MRYAAVITFLLAIVATAQDRQSSILELLRQSSPSDASVLDRDALARKEAQAAIRLLRLGQSVTVWPLLGQSSDNTRRSYLIEFLGPMGADPGLIIQHLQSESDNSIRRALILSLGGFGPAQLSRVSRDELVPKLLDWYRSDPDSGIHSAIDWLLRQGRQGEMPRRLDWQQANPLVAIDRELAGNRRDQRDWYLSKGGQTFVTMRGPVEFQMGSPADEPGRAPAPDSPDEPQRRVRIGRSVAIGAKEVTIAEFRRFLIANPDVQTQFTYPDSPDRMARVLKSFSPEDDGPQIAVTWYEAAMFCNWLSEQEGIPESEWVYPRNFADIKSGMELPADYLHRTGYRLPTEAEWEYAARAGSTSPLFFGWSDELLKEYAWYSKHPPRDKNDPVDPADPQRTWPVGQLKPNDFGLFDVYGNVWEWTMDRMQESFAANVDDVEDPIRIISDTQARSRRGGAFPYSAAFQRSADRDTRNAFPVLRRDNVGFRVARTLP